MVETPEFRLWLRIETGRAAALEANLTIPDEHLRIEIRVGGRWVEISPDQVTG
jgi:hypothetical protein